MTTIAIVVGSVFGYVVVAGRVYRWAREHRVDWVRDTDFAAAIFWPLAVAALVLSPLWRLGAKPRRRSKLPEARVRR